MKSLAEQGRLSATLRVPDAVGDIQLHADLRTRQTLTSVSVDAPRDGKAKARVNWLLRQLAEAPPDLRVDVVYPNARQTATALLGAARATPELLAYEQDPKREARSFQVTLSRPMGQKRGRDEGSFVQQTRAQTFDFYRDLVQNLKTWQPRPPKLHETAAFTEPADAATSDPPAFSDAEQRDPGEGRDAIAGAADA